MSELRWILLALGILLIGAIVIWERRRTGSLPRTSHGNDPRTAAESSSPLEARTPPPARAARRALPVIEFDDQPADSDAETGPGKRAGVAVVREHAVDVPGSARSAPEVDATATTIVDDTLLAVDDMETAVRPARMVLDWPPEKERRLVSVRLVARAQADGDDARFSGHLLRQALASEGFWHGKFDIFHLPLPDGRVVLSAAGLTQPGTFDLATMDSQRFVGLSIFGVLPGPLPDSVTFEELVTVARQLAERLGGDLQDSRGAPLTSARVIDLRATFATTDSPASMGGAS
ncbi:MAG TPA: cell division protein ZipA C-terminal FtsZ-binding domain-containing protein [Steroidobacteraceae bacterium]|nr:cell division protein ZipA C-terminal FtsZ-binding domain-containing protein [Steroidobacteraceae bacterium]HRX89589.1 cell division protein ZipA C-terminal FtsZ-binding domain-containing protein [Steroidobacteraceae bacterium]